MSCNFNLKNKNKKLLLCVLQFQRENKNKKRVHGTCAHWAKDFLQLQVGYYTNLKYELDFNYTENSKM